MSKKMLKRSLALGALMAFVITGSAMAAHPQGWSKWEDIHDNGGDLNYWQPYTAVLGDTENVDTENRVYTYAVTDGVYTLDTNGKAVSFNGVNQHKGSDEYNPNSKFHNTDLGGHKLIINHNGSGAAVDCVASYPGNFHWTPNDPENYPSIKMALPGFKFYTEGESKKGDLEINAGNAIAIGGHGDIDVNTLKITASTSNAINSNPSGINSNEEYGDVIDIERVRKGIVINANDVEINLTNGANVIQAYNQVTIGNKDDAVGKIDIKGGYERAIRVSGANVNIYADTLNLSGATEATKVNGNGALTLVVNNDGTITNEFYAGSTGTVDVELGAGVNWTGKFVTDENAKKGALDLSGTWNLKEVFPDDDDTPGEANSLTEATFRKGSTFVIDGATYVNNDGKNVSYALNGAGENAKLTVENGAKLTVEGIDYNTYNIAKGFATVSEDKWDVTNLNTLMEGKWVEDEAKNLQLQVVAKAAEQIAEDLGVSETTGDFLSNLAEDAGASNVQEDNVTAKGKLVGLANAAANSQNDKVIAKAAAQAAEAVQKMAEAGGNSATAANVVTNVTNVTGQRLSFSGGNAGGNKGGHGVGLLEEGSGAAIWAQYVHGKDSVEDMPSEAGASSYEGQYNGIVMGVDFKKVGKFQSGIAFNYGEGDTNSVNTTSPTRSEYDFWGVGYYGNIRNADSNVIFDIGYAKTDSDVTSNVNVGTLKQTYEASPETTTWTAGVKVEKLYQNNNVQIVPYTGLRYMSIDPEDYTTKCGAMGYKMERQDIWLLPVGVSIKQEIVNPNGWVVTPKVDLSYIWAFGDTDSSMETNTVFGSDNRPIGYDVMDDGSWMGLVGVEAAMDDWTFGVSYSYQKGDHSESKKWYVDAKYSF